MPRSLHPTLSSASSVTPALSKQIVGLDALRITAAFMVLAFHLYFWDWTRGNPGAHVTHDFDIFEPFVWFGWSGVEIFFVISGFVIAYSASGVSASKFLQHRLTRLFPAALLCASLTAVSHVLTGHMPGSEIAHRWLRSILFLPEPLIDAAYWTLTIEVSFYAVIYFLLLLKRLEKLPLVMSFIGGLSTFYWVIVFVWKRLPPQAQTSLEWLRFLGDHPNTLVHHGCYFAVGVFLWLCLLDRATWKRVAVLGLCIFGGMLQLINRSSVMGSMCGYRFRSLVPVSLWLGTLVLIVVATRGNASMQRVIGRRGVAILRSLGLMTYPLYLVHQQIGESLIERLRPGIGNLPALAAATLAVVTLAFVIATYLEPPLRNSLKRVLSRAL